MQTSFILLTSHSSSSNWSESMCKFPENVVRICQVRLTTSWLLHSTRISRDLVGVVPVPYAPSPLCPDTALSIRLRGTTCSFAGGDEAPLLGLLSRQARHESNCNSIVVSLRHLPFPFYPTLSTTLPAVLLLAPFPFWRLSGKMFELLFCPTAICGENCDLLLSARDSHQLSTSSSSSPSLPASSFAVEFSESSSPSSSSSSWSFGSFAFCSDTYHTVWQMLHKVLLNSLEVFNEMLRFCLCHRHRHRLCHCLSPELNRVELELKLKLKLKQSLSPPLSPSPCWPDPHQLTLSQSWNSCWKVKCHSRAFFCTLFK